MRNLFPKTFLVTWIAVGALWAGTLHAQVDDFVQVNLVSDIPGLAKITGNPLGSGVQALRPNAKTGSPMRPSPRTDRIASWPSSTPPSIAVPRVQTA